MTHSVLRRPPARGTAELLIPPTQRLPARPVRWRRDCVLCTAAGLAGYGVTSLLGHPDLANLSPPLGVLAGTARGAVGIRTSMRRTVADQLAEALVTGLGLRGPDRRTVKLRDWSRRWPGVPHRVDLRYAPSVNDTDPTWLTGLVQTVNRRLQAEYRVDRHDRRRCRIRLMWKPEADRIPAAHARAERIVRELLGATAVLTDAQWAGSAPVGFDVRHQAGARIATGAQRHRIERVISTMLPGRWRAVWDLEGDRVRFEIRPTLPQLVDHPAPDITAEMLNRLPLAIGEDGEVIVWDLRGDGPHLMVVGKTGTGKTVVINGVVMEAALRDWPVWICDPKRIEFLGMRRWPNVQIVATTVEHMIAVIWHAWEEMEHRYALVEAGLAYEGDFEPLIVVLDEYRDLVGMVTDWYTQIKVKGMPAKCPVFEKVASLARKGRSARVHLVLGTQRPDAEFLGGEMRDNFDTRISLGRLSPQGAQMMWEAAYVGVAIPRGIPGRGTAVAADGRPLEVQSYWTPDPRRAARSGAAPDLALLDRLRPTRATHEALQVELPEELLRATVGEDGKPIPARPWEAVLTAEFVPSMEGPAGESPRPFERYTADTDQVTESDPDAAADETDPMEGEELVQDDDYGPSEDIPVDQITEGDLILVDDVTQFWAVVESRERDLEDEDVFLIDWRTDDDEAGSLTIPDDLTVTARRPLDLDPEDAT